MTKKKLDAGYILQELLKRLGGSYTVKFAITDDFEQRVIVRNWITKEEKLNLPIYRKVKDPFDIQEVNKKILQTLQKL